MADFSRRGAISVLSKKSGSEGLLEGLSYDGRLSCVLVPACAVVLSYGGKFAIGTSVLGCIISYVLEILGTLEGALATLWLTISALIITLFGVILNRMSWSFFAVFLALNISGFLILFGLWLSLHVRWVRRDPDYGDFLETLLLSSLSLPAAGIWCWGLGSITGIRTVHFSLSLALALCYPLVISAARPNPYAGKIGDPKREEPSRNLTLQRRKKLGIKGLRYLSKESSVFHLACGILLPIITYVNSTGILHIFTFDGLCNIIIMTTLPLLPWLWDVPTKIDRGGLWFLALDDNVLGRVQRVVAGIATIAVVAAIQAKLVDHSLGPHLATYSRYPMATHVALVVGAIGLVTCWNVAEKAINSSPERSYQTKLVLQAASALVLFIWAALAGVPWLALPVAGAAGFLGARFLIFRKPWQLLIAAIGGILAYVFSINRVLGFVNLQIAGLSAKGMVGVLSGFGALNAGLLGISLLPLPSPIPPIYQLLTSFTWIASGLWLSLGEIIMSSTEQDRFSTEIYPGYMPVLTGIVAVAVSKRLQDGNRIGPLSRAIHVSLMAAKSITIWTNKSFATLACSFLVFLNLLLPFLSNPSRSPRNRPAFARIIVHSLGLGLGCLLDHETWVEIPLQVIFSGSLPPGKVSVPLTACWLGITLGIFTLVALTIHHRQRRVARRSVSLCILTAAILLLSKPGLSEDTSMSNNSDLPLYLALISAGAAGITAVAGECLPRPLLAAIIGTPLGPAITLGYMPKSTPGVLFVLLSISLSCAGYIILHAAMGGLVMSQGLLAKATILIPTAILGGIPMLIEMLGDSVIGIGGSEGLGVIWGIHGVAAFLLSLTIRTRTLPLILHSKARKGDRSVWAKVGNISTFLALFAGWKLIYNWHETEVTLTPSTNHNPNPTPNPNLTLPLTYPNPKLEFIKTLTLDRRCPHYSSPPAP
ncbi:hypothetical protein AAMO2058_000053300 [Amorphochlora amoebiformis]